MFTHGCPFDSSVISLHTLHYWHWTLIRDNSLIQLQPRTGRASAHLPSADVGAVPNKFKAGVFSRASNEGSGRFHNHVEGPHEGILQCRDDKGRDLRHNANQPARPLR